MPSGWGYRKFYTVLCRPPEQPGDNAEGHLLDLGIQEGFHGRLLSFREFGYLTVFL